MYDCVTPFCQGFGEKPHPSESWDPLQIINQFGLISEVPARHASLSKRAGTPDQVRGGVTILLFFSKSQYFLDRPLDYP